MVRGYGEIQTMQFRLTQGKLPDVTAYQLHLPDAWWEAIRAMARRASRRERATPPYASLHALLQATLPSLIDINYRAWSDPRMSWLLATDPVNEEAIASAMCSWLRKQYPALPHVHDLVRQMEPDQLQWQPVTVQLGADGPTGADFRLIPHLVSHALAQEGVETSVWGRRLHWHRVAASPHGTELLSWPPSKYEKRNRAWYFSYLLTFTVQTVPGEKQGYLHMDVGVRRWMACDMRLPGGKTSVFLQVPESWLAGDGRRAFCVAPAGWRRDGEGWRVEWKERLPEILADLHHIGLPDIEVIARDPEAYLQGEGIRVGITYSNSAKGSHEIGTGANPADRSILFSQVGEHLPWLQAVEPLPKPPVRKLTESDEDPAPWSAALRRFAGPEVCIEIWYQQAHVVDRLLSAAKATLGAVRVNDDEYQTPAGRVVIRTFLFPDTLTTGLPVADREVSFSEIQSAAMRRAEAVVQHVRNLAGKESQPATLAFVQIQNQMGEFNDAKSAIRSGFAQTGRLTQHLIGRDEGSDRDIAAKYRNTFLDLLRQAGRLPESPGVLIGEAAPSIPNDTQVMALWLIRRNEGRQGFSTYLPVAARVRLDQQAVEAAVIGGTDWEPYHALLLQLPAVDRLAVPAREVQEGIRRILREIAATPTLLMVDAHNLRSAWKWLANNRITFDALFLDPSGEGPVCRPFQFPGLRVARLRSNRDHETPQWYAAGNGRAGVTDALLPISERLFYSIAPKANTMRSNVRKPKVERPQVNSTMPAILEICFPFLQSDDDACDWAWAVHLLRQAHAHFDDATVLPGPLHMARQMEEYLVQVPGGGYSF